MKERWEGRGVVLTDVGHRRCFGAANSKEEVAQVLDFVRVAISSFHTVSPASTTQGRHIINDNIRTIYGSGDLFDTPAQATSVSYRGHIRAIRPRSRTSGPRFVYKTPGPVLIYALRILKELMEQMDILPSGMKYSTDIFEGNTNEVLK